MPLLGSLDGVGFTPLMFAAQPAQNMCCWLFSVPQFGQARIRGTYPVQFRAKRSRRCPCRRRLPPSGVVEGTGEFDAGTISLTSAGYARSEEHTSELQ